ncbi:GH1 family beta-glucosidase [Cellulosilyticum sp. I15G10I2]|uniref:GH1 family beta-glucosidase n=1 Tax=Cellulosilyticum sp. I15G10I2 TaxID=1892843 RepID=UPI00085BEFFC|nr:GH1 family beta-glucosidase [Cellulosilyticum sp. I15G10I2]
MSFPQDFIWGAATASYQIEGAAYEDGKGLSVWDVFCKEPGRVFQGHSGDVACDHYHRMKEDVKLMADMGLKAYRFSISWPRVIPNGVGEVNEKGLQFYSDLVDELIKYNITPYATLFHWDYPYELQKRGGWLNPDSPKWFEAYTKVVADKLGDRLKNYFTFNEPQCFIGISMVQTIHAPGIKYPTKDALQMAHNVLLAHGRAVKVLRETIKDCKIGYAPTGSSFYPATEKPEDIEAARQANFNVEIDNWAFGIGWWSDPVMLGTYPKEAVEKFGELMPEIGPQDMTLISQPLDFYGQNIYHSIPAASDGAGGFKKLDPPAGHPRTAIGWPITPESFYWLLKFLYERYKTPIVITENGMSAHDTISLDGKVHDPNRIDYLNRYLLELKKAIDDGIDVKGYFQWSLMDNFEWANGYNDRFGLVYVNFQTQERILKDSALWYKEVIRTNGQSL